MKNKLDLYVNQIKEYAKSEDMNHLVLIMALKGVTSCSDEDWGEMSESSADWIVFAAETVSEWAKGLKNEQTNR
jgi:hypothetical protein